MITTKRHPREEAPSKYASRLERRGIEIIKKRVKNMLTKKVNSKLEKSPSWANIQRNPFRATKQAVKARKQRFHRIDFPQLLRECEILAEEFKNGYCPVMKSYGPKGWMLK